MDTSRLRKTIIYPLLMVAHTLPAAAGPADVIEAAAKRLPNGAYVFIATIRHDDVDFTHFADGFEVVAQDGTILARRALVHPHIEEQPVTRATTPVSIPPGTTRVRIRAHDNKHGTTGREMIVDLEH